MGRRMGPAFRVLHWLLVGVTVAALIFVGLLGLRVLMGERVEFKRNSLDYMVLMDSSFIEGIDAGDCEASYYFLLGEDGQNDIHGVVLTHHEFPVEVIDALRKYVDSRGCSGLLQSDEEIRRESESGSYFYQCSGVSGEIRIWVGKEGGVWYINVLHRQ